MSVHTHHRHHASARTLSPPLTHKHTHTRTRIIATSTHTHTHTIATTSTHALHHHRRLRFRADACMLRRYQSTRTHMRAYWCWSVLFFSCEMRTFFFCECVHFFFWCGAMTGGGFWCVRVVLVSVFFCAGTSVLFWYWCVHAAGVYYECGTGKSRTRAHHHQVRAYWCWSVHFSFVISWHIGAGV